MLYDVIFKYRLFEFFIINFVFVICKSHVPRVKLESSYETSRNEIENEILFRAVSWFKYVGFITL